MKQRLNKKWKISMKLRAGSLKRQSNKTSARLIKKKGEDPCQ